ncbi:HEAT repeat domain-containing protein [Deinococcus sonorensis]|uniref:HEAT repeat domain-containing protein n=2 Tax=Deinococcus sonorensis TaxID=309891 RepID=A0AAU7U4N9_9DEIO
MLGFGLLALAISLILTLLMLATGFTLLETHLQPHRGVTWPLLVFTCVSGGLFCVVLSGLQFVQLALAHRSAASSHSGELWWSERLIAWVYAGEPTPRPLDRAGVATLLKLRDAMHGEDSDRLRDLYRQEGWLARDLRHLNRPISSTLLRAEAIERLALLRDPDALDTLIRQLGHRHPEVRSLALLAIARSIGRLPAGHPEQHSASLAVHAALTGGTFSVGQAQEALTLMDGHGLTLSRALLLQSSPTLQLVVLEVLARRRSAELHTDVMPLLHAAHPELRAGALKVLSRSGQLPPAAHAPVLALTQDPVSFVRLQATSAAALLQPLPEPDLWTLIGDPHWWVRRAAAHGLGRSDAGRAVLTRAGAAHPDRYARDIANDTLADLRARALP